jgi:hypothetical protein
MQKDPQLPTTMNAIWECDDGEVKATPYVINVKHNVEYMLKTTISLPSFTIAKHNPSQKKIES